MTNEAETLKAIESEVCRISMQVMDTDRDIGMKLITVSSRMLELWKLLKASAVPAGPRCLKCQSKCVTVDYYLNGGYTLRCRAEKCDFAKFFSPSLRPDIKTWLESLDHWNIGADVFGDGVTSRDCGIIGDTIKAIIERIPAPSPATEGQPPQNIMHRAFDFRPFREAAQRIDEVLDVASLDDIRIRLRNLSDELKQHEPIAPAAVPAPCDSAAPPMAGTKVEEVTQKIAARLQQCIRFANESDHSNIMEFISKEVPDILRPYLQVSPPPTVFIGDLRRKLFMPYDCAWNGYVRDVTAKLEKEGGLVSEEAVNYQVYKHCALLMQTQELMKSLAVAPVSGNGTEPPDAETEFRAWMATHSTTDYIGGELRQRAAIEFAEYYAKLAGAASHNGQGWEPPSVDEIVKAVGSGWEGYVINELSDLKFVIHRVIWAIRKCAPPSEANVPTPKGTEAK